MNRFLALILAIGELHLPNKVLDLILILCVLFAFISFSGGNLDSTGQDWQK